MSRAWTDEDARKFTAPCADRRQWDAWLTAHDARVAREALDGLSAWLGDLAEKHPARSAHVPLMQGHITRYTTDNYPEGDDQ